MWVCCLLSQFSVVTCKLLCIFRCQRAQNLLKESNPHLIPFSWYTYLIMPFSIWNYGSFIASCYVMVTPCYWAILMRSTCVDTSKIWFRLFVWFRTCAVNMWCNRASACEPSFGRGHNLFAYVGFISSPRCTIASSLMMYMSYRLYFYIRSWNCMKFLHLCVLSFWYSLITDNSSRAAQLSPLESHSPTPLR
jgi:hypothetical protein